jgi:putative Holliday junction resolvase
LNALTLLAFDYGLKNIGVAFGQSVTGTAKELPPLAARDGIPNWEEIAKLIAEWQPQRLLVGLPLNMDDSESELSQRARKFANRLHGRFGLHVELFDERLTTRLAKEEARERGHKGNYAVTPVDSIAARLLLESWFNSR